MLIKHEAKPSVLLASRPSTECFTFHTDQASNALELSSRVALPYTRTRN